MVEDDFSIRVYYGVILRSGGWEVREFADGQEALDGDWSGVTAAVVDLLMPRVDGVTVLQWLAVHHPNVKRVVCSALLDDQLTDAQQWAHEVIHKPFLPEQLWEALK